ncbi:MAG: cohesin domain-containing protein [Candidatus Bathyarchaeia archaeon]
MKKLVSIVISAMLIMGMLAIAMPAWGFTCNESLHVISPVTGDSEFIFSSDVNKPGDTFWANVVIRNYDGLYTWQIRILFNPEHVNVVSAVYGNIFENLPEGWSTAPSPVVINNDEGYILWGNSLTGEVYGVNGTEATLCKIKFKIMKEPPRYGQLESYFTFYFGVGGTFIEDGAGARKDSAATLPTEPGHYKYMWAPPATRPYLEVVPSEVKFLTGEMIVGTPKAEFTVDIWIKNLDKDWLLIAVQFMLFYNTTLLEVVSVTEGPFMQDPRWNLYGTYPITIVENNYIIMGDIILPNATGYWDQTEFPNGNGVLFTVKFRAIYQEEFPWEGSCVLDISKLDGRGYGVDVDNKYIEFDPEKDGFYLIRGYTLGRQIDVFTEHPAPYGGQGPNEPSDMFGPQEEVTLYALVQYNLDPVQYKLVYFYIVSPTGKYVFERSAFSNETGIATVSFRIPWPCANYSEVLGIWNVTATVEIAEETVIDTLQFKVWWPIQITKITMPRTEWKKGETMEITVEYGSYAMQPVSGIISVMVYDNLGVPIGRATANVTIGGASWCEFKKANVTVQIPIPKWAFVGPGVVYANCFSDLPWNGGAPLCPEVSKDITIVKP